MLLIPEIQIRNGLVVTRHSLDDKVIEHNVDPVEAAVRFAETGAEYIQVVDVDAARGEEHDNANVVLEIIEKCEASIMVAGGIRTLTQVVDWFEAGAYQVVLGTAAITDTALVREAAGRHIGGILVHLATKDGYAMINGWKTQTSYRPQDLIHDLQGTGIAGIIHKDINRFEGDGSSSIAITEELSRSVSLPVYSSGTVETLDDIARLRCLPNINGAIVSHALFSGDIELEEALEIAAQKDISPEPESRTPVVMRGIYKGISAYLAAYTTRQAGRNWNQQLQEVMEVELPYIDLHIPQLEIDTDSEESGPRRVVQQYEEKIKQSQIVIAILDNYDSESWIGYECGFARATGKTIYGVCGSNLLTSNPGRHNRLIGMCDQVVYFDDNDDIRVSLNHIVHELASRIQETYSEIASGKVAA